MITKEQNIHKYCCFYASNFHLEMILLPYIKNNLPKNKIVIVTEEDLNDSMRILIEKVNLKKEEKQEILKLNWNNNFLNIEKNNSEKNIIIINGNINYINDINKKTQDLNLKNLRIVDCYNISKMNIDVSEIKNRYEGVLNTEKIEV